MYNQSLINLKNIINSSLNTISFIKKSLPLYEEIKPLIKKIQNTKDILKNISQKNLFKYNKKESVKSNINKINIEQEKKDYNSNPQFFL